ncbi:FBP domain-containing protein [Actinomycetospora endophytica]|uniref:FBP domain-containing protein n=1 Tax=Actinomycetospora endophytica TaxID=2291215 RepID=A0ABS8PFH0_9PSEU|nr:FBP domain-containing protein [Actinomycetospora endophytica]MCD2196894.1 FBP domain-containing protein [Actinomycetospora endophytica]
MTALSADDIRRSMINCSKGDTKRMTIGDGVLGTDLDAVEFVGWHDPKMPARAYLLTRHDDVLTGVVLRAATGGGNRRTAMCALCRTTYTNGDVSLYAARRAGAAGREGSSVGTYICDDLACPVTTRSEVVPSPTAKVVPDVGLPVDERVAGLRTRVDAFLASVRRDG